MKKQRLFLIPLFCLVLTACGVKTSSSSSGASSSRISSSSIDNSTDSSVPSSSKSSSSQNVSSSSSTQSSSTISSQSFEESSQPSSSSEQQSSESSESSEYSDSSGYSSSEQQSSGSSIFRLDDVELRVNSDRNGLKWNSVEGAEYYVVTLDGEVVSEDLTREHLFSTDIGVHVLHVVARDYTGNHSNTAVYTYETIAAAIGELTYANGSITCVDAFGLGLLYKYEDNDYAAVTGQSVDVNDPGVYTFRATAGYDEINRKFYIDSSNNEKSILVSVPANAALTLEDGSEETDADLQDKYIAYKYDNGWNVSLNATLNLDESNDGFTNGKCVKVTYYKHSANFKYERKNLTFGVYNTLSVALKGTADTKEKFKIQFAINNDVTLAGLNLKGVYMTYSITNPSTNWTKYNISMDDNGWSIVLGSYTLKPSEAVAYLKGQGLTVSSFGEILPYFDTFSILTYCDHDENWSRSYFWFDDLMLLNAEEPTTNSSVIEAAVRLKDNYAFASDSLGGKLINDNGSWNLTFRQNGNPVSLPVTASIENNKFHAVCTENGYDFDLYLASVDGGRTFTLDSVTGSAAPLLSNLRVEEFIVVDDFSYANVAALKAAYYADFYNGGGNSTIGGNGWDVMTSTDNLQLLAQGHDGQGALIKYNKDNSMRYTTMGLVDGTAVSLGKANKLSFWTKGLESRDNVIRVRVFAINQVTPSTQQDASKLVEDVFTIEAGAGWTECVVDLSKSSHAAFYGVSIFPVKNNGDGSTSGNKYVPFDDITMYNDISPWGN